MAEASPGEEGSPSAMLISFSRVYQQALAWESSNIGQSMQYMQEGVAPLHPCDVC